MLNWSKTRLTELLVAPTSVTSAPGEGRISKISDVEGDALWTFRKGKKGCVVVDLNS